MDNVVPLDFAVIEFPGNQFNGQIAPELYNLSEQGLIRIVDAVLVTKDADGNYTSLELNQLDDDLRSQFVPLTNHLEPMFTAEDVAFLADAVPANSGALLIMWQNMWTENIRRAVANSNGRILLHERVPAEVLNEILAEMAQA